MHDPSIDRRTRAERHVGEGWRIIMRQRDIIGQLRAAGLDTSPSERLLIDFESSQAIFEADLEAITKMR